MHKDIPGQNLTLLTIIFLLPNRSESAEWVSIKGFDKGGFVLQKWKKTKGIYYSVISSSTKGIKNIHK